MSLREEHLRGLARLMQNQIAALHKKHLRSSRLLQRSSTALSSKNLKIPKRDIINLGARLGRGSFAEVFEVLSVHHSLASRSSDSEEERDTRNANHHDEQEAWSFDEKGSYVLKKLRRDLVKDTRKFQHAGVKLLLEAEYLARLEHPNIIRLHGIPTGGASCFGFGREFFLLLERVDETLSSRIDKWEKDMEARNLNSSVVERTFTLFENHLEQFKFALQIASALEYLHSQNILFRDLKPDNCGIQDNVLKLFDFGMIRELPKANPQDNELFRMTCLGTRRYMAPEVYLHEPYNAKVDIYSWAIVFHQMLSCKKPYDKMDTSQYEFLVCLEGVRPRIPEEWPDEIQSLLNESWAQRSLHRPTAFTVCERLRDITAKAEIANQLLSSSSQQHKTDMILPPTTAIMPLSVSVLDMEVMPTPVVSNI